MTDRYEGLAPADRGVDARRPAPAEQTYSRRIDCCDSPGSRDRIGGGRGRGALDAEAYGARPRRDGEPR